MDARMKKHARMKNFAELLPGAGEAIQGLVKVAHSAGVPAAVLELAHQRASQINGCAFCINLGARGMKKAGESDERLWSLAAWREAPFYTDAERAALALAECVTRLSDRPDPVPDDVWNEAARHFDETGLAALIVAIALINVWNRVNATVKQVAGASWN